MIQKTNQHYGEDGLQHWREGNGQSFVPNIYDPLYTNIVLESVSETMRWSRHITSWKAIARGTMNKIQVKRMDNPLIALADHFGKELSPLIHIDQSQALSALGKDRAFTLPRGMAGQLVLPEGSSRNSLRLPHGGSVYKANGVVPIGIHDQITTEEVIFQTFTDVQQRLMGFGDIIGAVTDSFYRDVLFHSSAWRHDFTKFKAGYNTLQSPVLGRLLERVSSDMKTYGAKPVSKMTTGFLNYGVMPIHADMILHIPYAAADSIKMNPDFRRPETYDNRTISEDEIGIIGGMRVITEQGMPLRENGDNRLIADMQVVAADPLVGLRLDGASSPVFTYIDPRNRDKENIHGRVGAIGVDAWLGAININPERSAVISMYINKPGIDDFVDLYEKCNEPCLTDCYEDLQQCVTEPCREETCGTTDCCTPTCEPTCTTPRSELADLKVANADEDAVDQDGLETTVEFVTYPTELSTATGALSTAAANLDAIEALQAQYGDTIVSRTRWNELYPTRLGDIETFVGTADGSVQPEA